MTHLAFCRSSPVAVLVVTVVGVELLAIGVSCCF